MQGRYDVAVAIYLRDDVKRLRGQVAASEKDKLEAHLKGYEDMRNRQSRLGEIEGTLRRTAPRVDDKFKSEVESDRLDAQFDIAAASLIGGLTNSITIASGVGNPYFSVRFTGLGIDLDKHSIGHGGSFKGMKSSTTRPATSTAAAIAIFNRICTRRGKTRILAGLKSSKVSWSS